MDGAFGAGTAVHFSPKDLGLNVGFLGLFSDSPRLDFWTVFGQSETKLLGLIFGQSLPHSTAITQI